MIDQKSELQEALKFIENIDALKNTYRKCLIMSGQREESTAEHSFSLAMAVLCLVRFSNQKIDVTKTVKMALFHDLAEALLGDTFHYDKNTSPQAISEGEALKQVLSPIARTELSTEIYDLWNEFENGNGPEAVFLRGLDRFLPILHNYKTKGHSWVKYGITKEKALQKNFHIEQSSDVIWSFTKNILDEAQSKGWIL
ncbi:MAG TPA: HD domain-containing protein [Pseudobdellovibrionaceae bacterium]|jgi:putative hydrolase of HD superfamily